MRPATRLTLAAACTLAVTIPLAGVASAAPEPKPTPTSTESSKAPSVQAPSQSQVDRARAEVTTKRRSVHDIEAALEAANARLEQAAEAAGVAAEAYNGAMWKLSQARKAVRTAQAREKKAKADVATQRAGIITLVTESYQNGTELNSATAILTDEGPKGLMNRYGVVESAGDSMEARYARFRAASALAKTYTAKATKARAEQASLTVQARTLRDQAAAAANAAAVESGRIAVQKQALIRALAKAQHISVALAGKRQAALEQIAQERAAKAAQAKQAEEAQQAAQAEQAATATSKADTLEKAAASAKQQATKARKQRKQAEASSQADTSDQAGGGGSADPAPPVDTTPPPSSGGGAKRALAYARAQLGKPYRWGAAGPSSFDCSGLTMMAWRAGGKSLPHWSVAQFQQSTRISVGQLRPGDLVFWGSSPGSIHHVALYIGNGQILHAPRTGQPVQINSMYYWVPPNYFARP